MKNDSRQPSLVPFWFYSLLFKFGAGLHYTLLSYLGSLVMPLWAVGVLIGATAFAELILDVPAGFMLDRFGYIKLLRLSTLFFIASVIPLFFGLTATTFTITVVLSGLGWLCFNPGTNAYVLSLAPREKAGKLIGFFHTMLSTGIVLASITFAFIVGLNIKYIALILVIILTAALAAAIMSPQERMNVHTERKIIHHSYYIRRTHIHKLITNIYSLNPALLILALQNLTGSIFYGVVWFIVPLTIARGGSNWILSSSLGVFDFSIVILGSFLGILADRWSKRRLIFYGLLLFAAAASLIGFNLDGWFVVLGFLATTGDEMSSVSLWAWINLLDKTHEQDGLITGLIVFFEDFGWALGPALAGILFVLFGPLWTLVISTIPIFIVWFISTIVIIRHGPIANVINRERVYRLRHKN